MLTVSFQLKVVEDRCRVAVSKKEELEGKISDLEKEKKGSDKRSSQLQSRVTKLSAELKEEKEVRLLWGVAYIQGVTCIEGVA